MAGEGACRPGAAVLIHVLGSAAGGGFPQWNCGCPNCEGVRRGVSDFEPRTQESVAVSADGRAWALLNASPDIGRQLAASPFLAPRAPRDSPIGAIVLTSGDLDHCLGLFSLRESQPLAVYATARVLRGLVERNALARTLDRFPGHVCWRPLRLGVEEALSTPRGEGLGLAVRAVAAPGKVPLHLERLVDPDPEDNIGLTIREEKSAKWLAYFPGVGSLSPSVHEAIEGADCLFFDGTFWSSDELIAQGLATARAEEMAHLPIGGEGGSLQQLGEPRAGRRLRRLRRLFIHVNNTNPILRRHAAERTALERQGWEVARDGLEVRL
jgi:pyrroloquinoline quinone biosynthesis protein B